MSAGRLSLLYCEHIAESERKKNKCVYTQHTRHVRGDTMSERSNDVSTFIVTTASVHIIIISVCYSAFSFGCVRVQISFYDCGFIRLNDWRLPNK